MIESDAKLRWECIGHAVGQVRDVPDAVPSDRCEANSAVLPDLDPLEESRPLNGVGSMMANKMEG